MLQNATLRPPSLRVTGPASEGVGSKMTHVEEADFGQVESELETAGKDVDVTDSTTPTEASGNLSIPQTWVHYFQNVI